MDGDNTLNLLNIPLNPASIAFFFGARHQLFGSAVLDTPTSRPWHFILADVVFLIQIMDSLGSSPTARQYASRYSWRHTVIYCYGIDYRLRKPFGMSHRYWFALPL